MSSTERSDPAWVAHEIDAALVRLAEKLKIHDGHLKSELKKVAAEWAQQPEATGCPQDAYLAFCVRHAALAAIYAEATEPLIHSGGENDPRVQLVRAVTNEVALNNDWSSLKNDLWASLDRPDLPPGKSDEIAAQLEVLESERVLVDAPEGPLTALRPTKGGPWPVCAVDANGCRELAPDLIAWIAKQVAAL